MADENAASHTEDSVDNTPKVPTVTDQEKEIGNKVDYYIYTY